MKTLKKCIVFYPHIKLRGKLTPCFPHSGLSPSHNFFPQFSAQKLCLKPPCMTWNYEYFSKTLSIFPTNFPLHYNAWCVSLTVHNWYYLGDTIPIVQFQLINECVTINKLSWTSQLKWSWLECALCIEAAVHLKHLNQYKVVGIRALDFHSLKFEKYVK